MCITAKVPVDEDVFINALKDPQKYVVECAIDVLGKMKCTTAIEPFLDFVRNYQEGQDFTLASKAIKALGLIGEDAVPVLLEEEKNGPANRGFVLRALAATGSPAAFDALKNGMADASLPGYEHEYIAKGLEKIGTEEAAACLKEALEVAGNDGLVKTIAECLERLNVPVDNLEEKKKAAEINSAKKLLDGLKAIHPGMSEDEADDLVGPGVFQMGANVVHKTKYGDFQLLVTNGRVTGTRQIDTVTANIEKWLKEQ
jgi:HEAT repeat protein